MACWAADCSWSLSKLAASCSPDTDRPESEELVGEVGEPRGSPTFFFLLVLVRSDSETMNGVTRLFYIFKTVPFVLLEVEGLGDRASLTSTSRHRILDILSLTAHP